ncbi:hypothetical protein AMJ44_06695 [candidate division WOR-1 bacterium DG_54_3]|uniref:Uncharacterized protein n=1 Tax=candidate division WOR-1 bacterium DG_54_3 TaxID=1703775 RepID=A0A0S7Y0U2_UNCSA|nr:MAG: hypothetical protein AMJ44_06695 [candidate division WOR-1 bacterium DG_54_3]
MAEQGLDQKLNAVAWALFFIMLGGLWLVPAGTVPESTWLLGVGIILLGLNAIRYLSGIKMSWLTLVLGFVALLTGVAGIVGMELPVFPIILIIIGVSIIYDVLTKKS